MNSKRVALITGGNRGIGKEIARQLAQKGLHVIIGCRSKEKGRQAVFELRSEGLELEVQVVDLQDPGSIDAIVDRIRQEHGRLDVLINNAGIILDRGVSVLDVEEDVMKETLETNFFGALRMIQAVVPLMKEQGYGRIVNMSSGLGSFEVMQGLLGLKGSSSAYRISKTMLNALTVLVDQEAAAYGIQTNAVCPGRVQTDMGGTDAPLSVAEGADTAVWLATAGEDGPSGGYFRERKAISW
ncbi:MULTISPECIES: SDR family oxidoreductase [Paenibacillus]|uniref:Short-chain dehydrogenase n=1 Tax=Paenibacillus cineris TaxID=237530 RepID=A0ABQ4LJR8_9BACL|nr:MULTISPECIES: SDR family oxidoreductase [Paenibacillus]UYO06616.1 SDR family NAD(P)-dependent oxidoreductase [Paenibacillus sp. PSB04]GIO56702.1 short-chain dehydrogenase [Paenibacillus cineris]